MEEYEPRQNGRTRYTRLDVMEHSIKNKKYVQPDVWEQRKASSAAKAAEQLTNN
jgi:hypothetical protein